MACILNAFLNPNDDGNDLIQTHISSHSSPVLLPSAQDHEGQPLNSVDLLASVQTLESVIPAMDTDKTFLKQQQDKGTDLIRKTTEVGTDFIRKTTEVTECLLKDWSVRKIIIMVTIFIVLCTTLIHTSQVDYVIE